MRYLEHMAMFAEILSKYGELSESTLLDAIEIGATRALKRALKASIVVSYKEQLEITMLGAWGESFEITPKQIGKRLQRSMLHEIEREIGIRQVLAESAKLKYLRGMVVPGVIRKIRGDNILVEMELEDQFARYILLGVCPYRDQPVHERKVYRTGDIRKWYVTGVLPVQARERTMIVVRLSRRSRELPAILLREKSGLERIFCIKRIPGALSHITADRHIPKQFINEVGKELQESIDVRIVK
jgi:hypothetical protein